MRLDARHLPVGRLKGQTPIMIDWSDLSRKRNGLFAAVCYRKRGLPLLSWATTHDELTPSQNRLEEAFIARLLRWLQEMPRHTGRKVDYVAPLKGNVHIQTPTVIKDCCGSIPCVLVAMCFCLGSAIVPMG